MFLDFSLLFRNSYNRGDLVRKKILLVTFPVDLGNATFETRFIDLFKDSVDLKVHRFIANSSKRHPITNIGYFWRITQRFFASFKLKLAVIEAQREGRKILFHGVSPALFAYPVVTRNDSLIVTDWTRKLYEPIQNHRMSNPLQTALHRKILNSQKRVMGLTDAVVTEISEDYDVPSNKLGKVKLPFYQDLEIFSASPSRNDDEIRILFVGGDFARKGGPALLSWFEKQNELNLNLKLTLMTNFSVQTQCNVTVEKNVTYREQRHINIFGSHDVFVLPTTCDSYPSVLGEAACSGLAILTTRYALGAPEVVSEGVNGYICGSQEALFEELTGLIRDRHKIDLMKSESRLLMEKNFSHEVTLSEYLDYIFED